MATVARKRQRYAADPEYRRSAIGWVRRSLAKAKADPDRLKRLRDNRCKWKTTYRRSLGIRPFGEGRVKSLAERQSQKTWQNRSANLAKANARQAFKYLVTSRASDQWLDIYWANQPRRWLDHRLSQGQRWSMRYELDAEFRSREYRRLIKAKAKRRGLAASFDPVASDADIRRLRDTATTCTYCSRTLTQANRSLDHVQPLSRGGLHHESNLVACCRSCNSSKGTRTLDEWRP